MEAPPQLWEVEMVKDHMDRPETARLNLRHAYTPKTPVDFAGPSYFGGRGDQLIVCAGKGRFLSVESNLSIKCLLTCSFICVRSRRYSYLGSRIWSVATPDPGTQGVDEGLTCMAWNPAVERFMFAAGSRDGAVQIWTTLSHSSHPSPYPEFTFQSEGRGGGTPRTRSPSIFPPEADNRARSSSTEGGLKAHELRASLDELGAQLRAASR
jgi:hypothetical protein